MTFQVGVIEDIVRQLSDIETAEYIMGVMIESHLVEGSSSFLIHLIFPLLTSKPHPQTGKQSIPASGPIGLTYGQSVTDGCISWTTTVETLNKLRVGVQNRRKLIPKENGLNRLLRMATVETPAEESSDFNDVNMFTPSA